ncbi:MAG: DUF2804 domain-containing protein [Clostridia bacterium]|nr:DUF2804 domain-containing protein [Clostridia bacterium]
MQHEITQRQPLLDESGKLKEAGYSKSFLLEYDRRDIKASSWRIKEWDYYLVMNQRFGIALTVADQSYMGFDSISFFDFEQALVKTKSSLQLFPKGNKNLPPTSEIGDISSSGSNYSIEFRNGGTSRVLVFEMKNFSNGKAISGEVILGCPLQDSIVIATPFNEDTFAFYYNQKTNCMPASGSIKLGADEYTFDPADSTGVLDWGRGVWPKNNTWYWASASGLLDANSFGFNIGCGFGDTSAATENVIFYRGQAHKILNVLIEIPKKGKKDDFMQPWTFSSEDHRFEMIFQPTLERRANMNALIVSSRQNQVFGKYSGRVVLDDGTPIVIENFFGFAEKVVNKW